MAFVGALLGVEANELLKDATVEDKEEACVEELDCVALDVWEEVFDGEVLEEHAGRMPNVATRIAASRSVVFFMVFFS